MQFPDLQKYFETLFSKKGNNLKLALVIGLPLAALVDVVEHDYTVKVSSKDSSISITPPQRTIVQDENDENEDADEKDSSQDEILKSHHNE